MPHETPLIATVVAGFGLAFVFGALASRLRLPPLVGYLLAGVVVGPHTPGFVADLALAPQLAELGVILLMFGVGLHFSLKDLLSVGAIATPGAIVQIAVATALGAGLAAAMGWPLGAGLVFGLALSVASTVVLLRALHERRLVDVERGRIAIGWLIVEDLAMVLALVMLPGLAGPLGGAGGAPEAGADLPLALAATLAKVAAFVALMLVVGRRLIPRLLHVVAYSGERELFRLAVLAIALGVAFGAAQLFDVSLALGAFFAGMVMSESELSHRAAKETLPLRDAFSVLFFVAVGMLFNPMSLFDEPGPILATLFIIVIGKSAAAFLIVRAFRHPVATALTISASLAQIGEFSFILAELGVQLGILPEQARDLIVAGALLSIVLNPATFAAADWLAARMERARPAEAPEGGADSRGAATEEAPPPEPDPLAPTELSGHVILVGYGRVGSLVGRALKEADPFVVLEDADKVLHSLREAGVETIVGNAARPETLKAANLAGAAELVVAIPVAFEAGQVVQQARAANPALEIIARAHSDAEVEHLTQCGANLVVMGERELARGIVDALQARAPKAEEAGPPDDEGPGGAPAPAGGGVDSAGEAAAPASA